MGRRIAKENISVPNNTAWYESFKVAFAKLNRNIIRDLNQYGHFYEFVKKFPKAKIARYVGNPAAYQRELREAVIFLYNTSPHFKRFIQFFVGLNDFAYIVSPYNIDPRTANPKTIRSRYRETLRTLSNMSIKTQFPQILTVCMREDVFFGTFMEAADDIQIKRLPSDYCAICVIEGKVPNVHFDFSYFDIFREQLDFYPEEFKRKYEEIYKKTNIRWIELDAPNSFAVKANMDILGYAVPPLIGVLRELYDLEDYKELKLSKEVIENYALLAMKIPIDDEGNFLIDEGTAEDFWRNLDSVMPSEVGSVLTPMDIDKIDFKKSTAGDADTVAEAEESLFTSAGVQSMLFNNPKASSNALLLSIKVDQSITYGIVKSIEDVVNRFIQSKKYGKNFKVTFLDCSRFNSKELGDSYLKAASYGAPTISMYCASQGLSQADMEAMTFLETDVLKLQEIFKPLINSSQLSADERDGAGAPKKEIGEVSDKREANEEAE